MSGIGTFMSHMPPVLAVMALDLLAIISSSSLILLLIVSGCIISVTILPLGPLAVVIGILIVISLTMI